MEAGKDIARDMKQHAQAEDSTDQTLAKLKKAAEMHHAGILTDEEFRSLKEKLLAQI